MVEERLEEIGPGLFLGIDIPGCNPGYIVTSEGVVLIDTPQPPAVCVRWREELRKYGPVVYIISTEHHIDHILGYGFFEGVVVSHEGTKELFYELSPVSGANMKKPEEFVARKDPDDLPLMEGYAVKEPTITFSDRMTLYVGEEEIRLINLPSHVMNTTIVHLPRHRVAYISDVIFNNYMPWLHQCVPHLWLKALDELEAMDLDVMAPSHGDVCDKSYIPVMRSTLTEIFDTVESAIEKGMTREEAVESITFIDQLPIPPWNQAIAPLVQKLNIGRVYDQLKDGKG